LYSKEIMNNQALITGFSAPGYLRLLQKGELSKRIKQLYSLFEQCRLCPWTCGVSREKGERGRCRASSRVKIAKALPHFGEEPVISGTRGSGTIFFSNCSLSCCYCQNYQISHGSLGREITVEELSAIMVDLQEKGCHNINLVSASHYMPPIIEALQTAAQHGLSIPIVYNSNGYENTTLLRILDGIIDIYLPDIKYASDMNANKYSSAVHYTRITRDALQEMFQQVGTLVVNDDGLAQKGLIIRHLVLPNGTSGTEQILEQLHCTFGPSVAVSIMGQYIPCFQAHKFPEINIRLSKNEYNKVIDIIESLGFENGWIQDRESLDTNFIPDFNKSDSWN